MYAEKPAAALKSCDGHSIWFDFHQVGFPAVLVKSSRKDGTILVTAHSYS